MSIDSVIPSNYLILCHSLLLLPSVLPSIGSLPVSRLFAWGGQRIGASASASASVLPMNIQDWFPLGLIGLISLLFKGLSRVFPSTVWKHQFFGISLLYGPALTSVPNYWKHCSFDCMDLGNHVKSKFQCPWPKSDWFRATLTWLHTVCGCSCGNMVKLNGSNRAQGLQSLKYLPLGLWQKKLKD